MGILGFFGGESYKVECARCRAALRIEGEEIAAGRYICPVCGHSNPVPADLKADHRERYTGEGQRIAAGAKRGEQGSRDLLSSKLALVALVVFTCLIVAGIATFAALYGTGGSRGDTGQTANSEGAPSPDAEKSEVAFPADAVRPVDVQVLRSAGLVRVLALFDCPPPRHGAEQYLRWARRTLREERRAYLRANTRDYGGWFLKGRIECYVGRRAFEFAHSNQYLPPLAETWTNLDLPDKKALAYERLRRVDLPESNSLESRLSAVDNEVFFGESWEVFDTEGGVFRTQCYQEKNSFSAHETLVLDFGASGELFTMQQVLQYLPELRVLQVEVPIKGTKCQTTVILSGRRQLDFPI